MLKRGFRHTERSFHCSKAVGGFGIRRLANDGARFLRQAIFKNCFGSFVVTERLFCSAQRRLIRNCTIERAAPVWIDLCKVTIEPFCYFELPIKKLDLGGNLFNVATVGPAPVAYSTD